VCRAEAQKLRLFLLFEGAHPLGTSPGRVSKSSVSYANCFFKKINLYTNRRFFEIQIQRNLEGFFGGKIHTRISFSEFSIIESVASIQRERERENIQWQTWIVFTTSCILLFLTFFS
jgi:hypothetical protein